MAHFLCAIWYNSLSEALRFCSAAAAVVQEFFQLGCTLGANKNLLCSFKTFQKETFKCSFFYTGREGHLASLSTWLQKKRQEQETNVLVTPSSVLPTVAKPCFASWVKTTKRPLFSCPCLLKASRPAKDLLPGLICILHSAALAENDVIWMQNEFLFVLHHTNERTERKPPAKLGVFVGR